MANGLRKLMRMASQANTRSLLSRKIGRLGSRLRVEELEERIAPAITAFGTVADAADGNTTVTLDQVGDGFTFTEADGDVWALALVSSVGGAGTALTSGDVVITLSANDTAGAQDIDTIDFGNAAALTTADAVGIVFQLTTSAGNGLLDIGAGDAVIDTSDNTGITIGGVYGVSVSDGTLDAASDVATVPSVDATMSSRLDFTGANVNVTANITSLYVGNMGSVTSGTITTISSDDATIGASGGDIGAMTITGSVGTLTVDDDLTGVIGISAQITGPWTIGDDIADAADITVGTGVTAAGDFAVAGDMVGDLVTSAGEIAGDVIVTGTIGATTAVTGDDGISGAIQAATISGTITCTDGDMSGSITSTSGGIGTVAVDDGGTAGDLTGTITSASTITAVNVGDDITGNITASGTITAVTSDNGNISSTVQATGGDITTVTLTNGTVSGTIKTVTSGNIGTVTIDADDSADGQLTGTIQSAGTIGIVDVGDAISGTISANGAISTRVLTLNGSITSTATITAAGSIAAVTVDANGNGALAGTVTANGATSDVSALDVGGAITGTVTAGRDIGTITADAGISGTLTAGDDFTGAMTITTGGISGTLTATDDFEDGADITIAAGGFTGALSAGGDFSANVTDNSAAGGSFSGTITSTGGQIGGGTAQAITVANNPISGNITASTDIAANVTATANAITSKVEATTGNLSGTITAGTGDVANVVVGGNFTGSVIAEDDVTSIAVTGNITGATITADSDSDSSGDVVLVTADGSISGTITGQNIGTIRSGGTSGTDNITATITADADLDLIDGGSAAVTGVVTATAAASGSPLATFIQNGVSYAVWAFESGSTTTVDTGVTATVVFDGNAGGGGIPQIAITNLADSSTATTPDIYVTTRVDTGAAQAFTDSDVPASSTGGLVEISTFTAASAVTVGNVSFEGNFDGLGSTTNITATAFDIEGGVGGAVTVTSGSNVTYGSISATGLTITGSPAKLSIQGDVAGALTVNGSVTELVVGESALGQVGDINAAVTVTGSIGELTVDGDIDANVSATSIGGISVGGNIGSPALGAGMTITASTGDIGNVFVGGIIGADAGQSVTIRSTAGNIGNVTAVGGIATAAGGTTIVANGNIGDVSAPNGNIGSGVDATITATTGTIGTVSGLAVDADITADGNITAVTATADAGTGIGQNGTTTIISNSGNIGTVSTVDAPIAGTITATVGNVDSVVSVDGSDANNTPGGANTANITAGGDVDTVAGGTVTGTIAATLGTTSSPVLVVTAGATIYTFDATEGPLYNFTYTGGATPDINITIDNWDNTNTQAYATTVDISLWTTALDTDGSTILSAAQYDLSGLDFDADSVVQGVNDLGTVTVEGDVTGAGIDSGVNGTLVNLFVEGNVVLPVITTTVSAVSAGSFAGIGDAVGGAEAPLLTAAVLETMFVNPTAGAAVTFAVPADGTLTVPVASHDPDGLATFVIGDGTNLGGAMILAAGETAGVGAYEITIASGVVSSISGTVLAGGNVTITGDLTYIINGVDLDTITVTGSITSTGGLNANDIGNINVGTAGDTATGDMAGTITSTAENGQNGDIGAVTVLGDLSGTIQAERDITSVTVGQQIADGNGDVVTRDGSISGAVVAGRDMGNVIAEVNLGGVIMVGRAVGNFTATSGDVTADIFGGGNGAADVVTITGNNITGDLLLGAGNGVGTVTLSLRETVTDPDTLDIAITPGAASMLDIAAGGVTSTGVTIDSLTLIGDSAAVTVLSDGDAQSTLTNLFVLENTAPVLAVTIEGDLGTLVAADGNTALSNTEALQTAFLTAYNTDAGTSFTFDVIDEEDPTALDDELNDDQNIEATLTVNADNVTGGLLTSGDMTLDADIPGSLGFVVSLNGSLDTVAGGVHAGVAIGDLVASTGLDGDWISEGTFATAATTLSADLTTAYGSAIGGGVPAWFTGGILVEAGDIDTDGANVGAQVDLVADGTGALVGGVLTSDGYVMGTIYVPAGDMNDVGIHAAGNFGGIQVPAGAAGVVNSLDLFVSGNTIDTLIAPVFSPAANSYYPEATIQAISGERIVSSTNAYDGAFGGNLTVTVSDGVIVIVDNDDADLTQFDSLIVVGLDGTGTTVAIEGDVDTLRVASNWVGGVTVDGVEIDETDGTIQLLQVDGNITSTATLTANNFVDQVVDGTIDSAVQTPITLVGGRTNNPSTTFTNVAGDQQTIWLNGGRAVSAEITTLFGKPVEIELMGRGAASLVSVNGSFDATDRTQLRDLRRLEAAARRDRANANLMGSDGTASLGVVDVSGSQLALRALTVDGDVTELQTMGKNLNSLFVGGDAYGVQADVLNNAFIKGDAGTLDAVAMRNVNVEGDAASVEAWNIRASKVLGTTTNLTVQGVLTNSLFADVTNATVNRAVRSSY